MCPLPGKITLRQTLSHQVFIFPIHQSFIPNEITAFMLKPHKNFIFSCCHCSCTIFNVTPCFLYTQVKLILILIEVQYFQNGFLALKKFRMININSHQISNTQSKVPQQDFLFLLSINAIWKILQLVVIWPKILENYLKNQKFRNQIFIDKYSEANCSYVITLDNVMKGI